ncbi:MAG: glycosyltransferase family 9 protein, partial [Pseudomonadota bacterium]|nr:glycosyltransferase family 9 protein [Pseudomonadota bacterium]
MAKRILFISATRLGDAVLGTGVLAQALARWPGARVTLVCGPAAAPLFAGLPDLETCLVLCKGRGLARHAH